MRIETATRAIYVELGNGELADLQNELTAALLMLDRMRADGDVVLIRERVEAAMDIAQGWARGGGE